MNDHPCNVYCFVYAGGLLCEAHCIKIETFNETISWRLVKATKRISHAIMSGEGLVNLYTGPGTLMFQTRGKAVGRGWLFRALEAFT
jgi:hypothetical protein